MNQLPTDIEDILQGLAESAASYQNRLKWNEIAMLKSDLMLNRAHWRGFDASLVGERCRELGMTDSDAREVEGYVAKAQAGRRLVPDKSYRGHTFPHDQAPPAPGGSLRLPTSIDW
ncbi:hypothetical protein [Brachybacterium alimentarium]|uniref:hypothetical protein n=1 Tax=Brachybacterium alimentarium TaxID=47845 RepID=UPI003FCF2F70